MLTPAENSKEKNMSIQFQAVHPSSCAASHLSGFRSPPPPFRPLSIRSNKSIVVQKSMSIQSVHQNAEPQILRRTANYHPSIWGDRFLNYTSEDHETQARMQQEVDELKIVVRKELIIGEGDFSHQLNLINAIQRLGVAYHFEGEIEAALKHMHYTYHDHINDGDLYNIALGFRLLRQHGFKVSCDVFSKFKDANGRFKECLISDVSGMLSFYEATHLRVRGEDILEEALVFTTTQLETATTHINSKLVEQITQALERPMQKSPQRLYVKHYMSIYQDETSYNEALLKLAKLDFNLVQSFHKRELSEISRWWKELDFESKLPFARDRIVELFFWMVGIYFEPQYVVGRKILTKLFALVTIMDDIYDAFGIFEELEVFTKAIERWDVNCMNELPEYMQIFYRTLLDVLNEVEGDMIKEGRTYRVQYVKEIMITQARLYFAEAQWYHNGRIPSTEEYMRVAASCVGNALLSVTSLVGMGDIVTKETFEWLLKDPKILRASNIIFRLMNDMAGDEFEKERGHVASSIDCYMKQYEVSEEEAIDVFNKQIVDSWKDINEELNKPTVVPMPVLVRVLNLTRVVDLLYKGEADAFTHVGKVMTDCVASHFIDPLPL